MRTLTKGRCESCGCEVQESLCKREGKILCYECLGRKTEVHHVLGRQHNVLVSIPGNPHRFITARYQKWPEVLRKANNDPILEIARVIRIAGDFAEFAAEHPDQISGWIIHAIKQVASWAAKTLFRASDWLVALYRLLKDQGIDYQSAIAPLRRAEDAI